ncbi:hypothetical protein [Streptomyces spiramenti]|uniref:Uncharacterized protein n=1 Tax=Streptomyces spiramenti TaxID=2720606 RepID=A0ABX1AGF4_9ACTN|nr:hypothetical protein [Streptomyces spiramenti]NJP64954.1 hypothetical protein [Streptomyces spiramenti]
MAHRTRGAISPLTTDRPPPLPGRRATEEPRGCLFALAQLPLIIFLAVIGTLLTVAAVHDLFLL